MNKSKKRISVQIEGRNYVLITTDDAKYVNGVAKEVSNHIRSAAQTSKQLDTRDCAVLTALDFCDDRNKALKRNQDLIDKADTIIKQTNELSRNCKEYKERLTSAINENTSLTKRVRTLERQLAELEDENNRLNELLPRLDEKEDEKALQSPVSDSQYSLFDRLDNTDNDSSLKQADIKTAEEKTVIKVGKITADDNKKKNNEKN